MNLKPVVTLACLLALAACTPSTDTTAPAVAPTELAALQTPPPEYPLELACADIGGTVTLSVTVGTEGKPTAIEQVGSSGDERLDSAARTAVEGWLFKPATRNGQAIAQTIRVPVSFNPPQPRPDACFALDEQH
ncbi:energy transducer TonB [Pseudoxanthomonas kalamensis DSM 18571]|uniref:energy transducer TonB n=1 Tax=Pseudoxanthomonas kalamensis TaxID=289483 RepID=UPI001391E8BB|nr:energy transducer TonB [Pseudoxanthomonas kalamensis]KAF1709733.1 energy transducer TonB [Pseudoxanthomonas kalamensis DSM 18571]